MRLMWISLAAAGALASLAVTQAVQTRAVDEQLEAEANRLLALGVEVARQSRQTLGAINALSTTACTAEDIVELRYIMYGARYLQDVGRSLDGRVICTAIWGVLADPIRLPAPDVTTSARELLWRDVRGVPDRRLTSDIGMSGEAVTFTRREIFASSEVSEDRRALLVAADGAHIFREFGEGADVLLDAVGKRNAPFRLRGRHRTVCDVEFGICAVVRSESSASIFGLAPGIALAVMLLGGAAGAGAGYAIQTHRRTARDLKKQLRRALRLNTFRVAYQPIVRLRDRGLAGVEALARWNDDAGAPVSPEVFIREIEGMGLLGDLTRLITGRAIAELGPLLARNPDIYVSINVGVSDVVSNAFHSFLFEVMAQCNVSPGQVALEITERGWADMDHLADAVALLRSRGLRIFIDDFGTGYSGIAYLANMPVDTVKVDRMFTRAVGTDSVKFRMFELICTMIADVGGKTRLEGIETEQQAAILLARYPTADAQGWLFGRPVEGVAALSCLLDAKTTH